MTYNIWKIAIDAALSLLEALIFGVLFYLVYQVSDITEMKRPSKAGMLDTPSTQRRLLLAPDAHPTVTVVVKEPTSQMNPTTNTYNGMTFTVC